MANLSHLPDDLLTDIARRLKKLEDYMSFTCVSKSLRAAVKQKYFEGLPFRQHTPYMLLSVREGGNDDVREVYSLVENESIVASVKVLNFKRKSCLESLGWLLVTDLDGSSCLLNSFSGTKIPVPHQEYFPQYRPSMRGLNFYWKMVLSSNPSETSDLVLMVIGGRSELAFWRLGDKAWTRIGEREGAYSEVVHHGGKFYAFGHPGMDYVFNLFEFDNQIKVEGRIVVSFIPANVIPNSPEDYNEIIGCNLIYLLKGIDDSLLLITRPTPHPHLHGIDYVTPKFQVYDLDEVGGTWKEIYTLGSMAVFLGHNSTTFVDASKFPGVVKANHIYFTDDNYELYTDPIRGLCGGYDSGIYNVATGSVEPVYPGEPLAKFLRLYGLLRVSNSAPQPIV